MDSNRSLALSEQWKPQSAASKLINDKQAQVDISLTLAGCFALLDRFGKTTDDLAIITPAFIKALENYHPEDIKKAFDTYIKSATNFPKPVDISKIIDSGKKGSPIADAESTHYPWVKRSFRINKMVHEADAEFRNLNRIEVVKSEGWDHHLMELVRNIAYVQAQVVTRNMLTVEVGYGIPAVVYWPFKQSKDSFWNTIKYEAQHMAKPFISFNDEQKIQIRDYFRMLTRKVEKAVA